jgi:hypothetical protein
MNTLSNSGHNSAMEDLIVFGESVKKKLNLITVLVLLLSTFFASNSLASEIVNSTCINIGSERTVNGIKYVCTKVGNVKQWKISTSTVKTKNNSFISAGKALQSIYAETECLTQISLSTKGGNGAAVLGINDTSADCSSQESYRGNFIFVYSNKDDIAARIPATKRWPLTHISVRSKDYLFEFASDAGDIEWLTNLATKINERFTTTDVIRVLNGPGPNCRTVEDQKLSMCRIHYNGVFTSPTALKTSGACVIPGYQIKLKSYYSNNNWVTENPSDCTVEVRYTGLLKCSWKDNKNKTFSGEVLIDRIVVPYDELAPRASATTSLTDIEDWSTDCQNLAKPYKGTLSFDKQLTAWVAATK